jgi:hypothetical protein
MDPAWLARELAAGRSIESLAREVGRSPSTVAYWVNTHGLQSTHGLPPQAPWRDRARHTGGTGPGGPLDPPDRAPLRRQRVDRASLAAPPRAEDAAGPLQPTRFRQASGDPARMPAPRLGAVRPDRRRGALSLRALQQRGGRRPAPADEAILVAEAGGACAACGFAGYLGALQFHHRDPALKSFELSRQGVTRSLEKLRQEGRKCVLLCANCHAMAEAGLLLVPAPADDTGSTTAGRSPG